MEHCFFNEETIRPRQLPPFRLLLAVTWRVGLHKNNIVVSEILSGTTYPEWDFDNGANANVTAAKGTSIGVTEIPQTNPNYGAMWVYLSTISFSGWIDYSWYTLLFWQ
jgi:hypothetical protein